MAADPATAQTLLLGVPDVVWSGIVAAVMTLVGTLGGVIATNWGNTKRLKLQLDHRGERDPRCLYTPEAMALALWAMYHWRKVLVREGQWRAEPNLPGGSGISHTDSRVPLRFARVAATDAVHPVALIVRVQLANGRRAEFEVSALDQLGEVLGVLERRA